MSKTTSRQKTTLVLAGIIATLLAIELVLRLAGAVHVFLQDRQNRQVLRGSDTVRILCVGESTTYMGKDHAYPRLLERILNERDSSRKYSVLNKGQPGTNSQRILADVETWLDEYQPQIVTVMMGINDDEQMTEYRPCQAAEHIAAFVENLRVVKLAVWLKAAVPAALSRFRRDSSPTVSSPPEPAGLSFEEKCLQDFKKYPVRLREIYLTGVFAAAGENYSLAEKAFETLARANLEPDLTLFFYKRLGPVLLAQENYDKLSRIIMDKLAKNDRDYDASVWLPELIHRRVKQLPEIAVFLEQQVMDSPESFYYYDYLVALHSALGNKEKAEGFYDAVQAIRHKFHSPYTQRNYQELLAILKRRGIKPVFVQYPLRDLDHLKRMFDNADGVIFVDNEAEFKARLLNGRYEEYFTDRFAGDFGHCTPLGNELIARNVAEAVLAEWQGPDAVAKSDPGEK